MNRDTAGFSGNRTAEFRDNDGFLATGKIKSSPLNTGSDTKNVEGTRDIDDFGTGYSSLSYLKRFDIDYLKIDRSFVNNLETDANNMALSEAIIVMAHKLGLKVIAEGIETEGQRKLLADAGCDYGQGFLFSQPVPPEQFEKLLLAQNPRPD